MSGAQIDHPKIEFSNVQSIQEAAKNPPEGVSVIETHISWVFLTENSVFKIKKPVDLGFVNFTTLDLRRQFCEAELQVNSNYAPSLYRGLLNVARNADGITIGGPGEVIDFAVFMNRFRDEQILSNRLASDSVSDADIVAFADRLAHRHSIAQPVKGDTLGHPKETINEIQDSVSQLQHALPEERRRRMDPIKNWIQETAETLRDTFLERRENGFVRDCHGDMHMDNLVYLEDQITPFDAIEFNPHFRWIDVISDLAFPVMDLRYRKAARFSRLLLKRYLEQSGDYDGLRVLDWYVTHRALARAKIAAMKAPPDASADQWESVIRYLDLVDAHQRRRENYLCITVGVSGSGKTTGSQPIVDATDAIRIRSDIERDRLPNRDEPVQSNRYSEETIEKTYDRLLEIARVILSANRNVLVDATFLSRDRRRKFSALANAAGASFRILHFDAPKAHLKERVANRLQTQSDASEATPDLVDSQLESFEPFTESEQSQLITPDDLVEQMNGTEA